MPFVNQIRNISLQPGWQNKQSVMAEYLRLCVVSNPSFRNHSLSDQYLNNRCTHLAQIWYLPKCVLEIYRLSSILAPVQIMPLEKKWEIYFPILISTTVALTYKLKNFIYERVIEINRLSLNLVWKKEELSVSALTFERIDMQIWFFICKLFTRKYRSSSNLVQVK